MTKYFYILEDGRIKYRDVVRSVYVIEKQQPIDSGAGFGGYKKKTVEAGKTYYVVRVQCANTTFPVFKGYTRADAEVVANDLTSRIGIMKEEYDTLDVQPEVGDLLAFDVDSKRGIFRFAIVGADGKHHTFVEDNQHKYAHSSELGLPITEDEQKRNLEGRFAKLRAALDKKTKGMKG